MKPLRPGESTGRRRVDHIDVDTGVDLVAGLLGADERRKWLEHAQGCESCESLIRTLAADHARLIARGAPAARASESEAARRAGRRTLSGAMATGWRRWVVAVATVTVLATAAWYARELPHRNRPGEEGAVVIPVSAGSILTRGGSRTPFSDSLARAVVAYDAGRLREARARLEALMGERPAGDAGGDLVRVYLASVRARLGDWRGAVNALAGVDVGVLPEPWRGVASSIATHARARDARPGGSSSGRGHPTGDRLDSRR